MQVKKHRRKINHVVIVTSDAADASVKQFRIRPWILETIIVILCIIIGAMVGYLIYEEKIWDTAIRKNNERIAVMEQLEQENEELQRTMQEREDDFNAEVESLNDKILVLSNTLEKKVQSENELMEQLNSQSTPTEFPLNGPANVEEVTEGTPMCIFTASEGTTVVATASGTVMAVNDDVEYGHNVWIDHGNGYITIYRNQGDVNVKLGDRVVQGTTLYVIGTDNMQLGYQMMQDNEYMNPMDMLAISG
ncbi:MAG: M23 family metallopeptidase [Roseburia sp.]|nr:M23 family metallopeptidase [Roseburia sp.]